jgi:hypothetical protein
LKKTVNLFAPESYIKASPEVKAQVLNGCGTAGWKGELIPDNLLGLTIHDCCDIHDWMYTVGQTVADKEEADRVFLNNLIRICGQSRTWIMKRLRLRAAYGYYEAVEHFGGPAFWANVNEKKNYVTVGVCS